MSREPAASAFEIYDGDFKQLAQPARYWETQHPLGLTGLARLSVAVESVEAAVTRLHELAEVSEMAINPARTRTCSWSSPSRSWRKFR